MTDTNRGARRGRWSPAAAAAIAVGLLLAGCSGEDGAADADRSATPTTTTPPTTTVPALPAVTTPLVVAHRGASGLAPELTFAAFDLAVEQESDYLEIDLQMTEDGGLVVLHDPVLDRVARGPAEHCAGAIDIRTVAQLRSCDVGSWFNEQHPELADPAFVGQSLPTFQELLTRYGTDVRWYVETKKLLPGEGMEEELVAALDEAGFGADDAAAAQIVVQSFDVESVRSVHALRPDLFLAQLIHAGQVPDEAGLETIAGYADSIGPLAGDVDRALVEAAHRSCLTVVPYTVDDPAEIRRLLDLGVDGIITNRPDVLRPLVAGRTATPPCP